MSAFYYHLGERVIGPVTGIELREAALGGTVLPDTMVATDSQGPFVPANRIRGLFNTQGIPLAHPPEIKKWLESEPSSDTKRGDRTDMEGARPPINPRDILPQSFDPSPTEPLPPNPLERPESAPANAPQIQVGGTTHVRASSSSRRKGAKWSCLRSCGCVVLILLGVPLVLVSFTSSIGPLTLNPDSTAVELVDVRLVPFTMPNEMIDFEGTKTRETQMVVIDWTNTGTAPIGAVYADITVYGSDGNVLKSSMRNECVFTAEPGEVVEPGHTYLQPNDEGQILLPSFGRAERVAIKITQIDKGFREGLRDISNRGLEDEAERITETAQERERRLAVAAAIRWQFIDSDGDRAAYVTAYGNELNIRYTVAQIEHVVYGFLRQQGEAGIKTIADAGFRMVRFAANDGERTLTVNDLQRLLRPALDGQYEVLEDTNAFFRREALKSYKDASMTPKEKYQQELERRKQRRMRVRRR